MRVIERMRQPVQREPVRQVWIIPGWKRGFCPLHILEQRPCNWHCRKARVEFADAARELDYYWRRLYRPVQAVA